VRGGWGTVGKPVSTFYSGPIRAYKYV